MTLNSKKHLYVFRIKCDSCENLFNMNLVLYEYVDPEWLIQSVPIRHLCKRCNVQREVRTMVKEIKARQGSGNIRCSETDRGI